MLAGCHMLARLFCLVAWHFRFRMRRVVSTWSMLVHAMGSVIAMAVVIQVQVVRAIADSQTAAAMPVSALGDLLFMHDEEGTDRRVLRRASTGLRVVSEFRRGRDLVDRRQRAGCRQADRNDDGDQGEVSIHWGRSCGNEMITKTLGFVLKQSRVRDTSPTREQGTRYERFH
jgi:hypothetical protein